jgi:hypothetical protein
VGAEKGGGASLGVSIIRTEPRLAQIGERSSVRERQALETQKATLGLPFVIESRS